MTEVLHQIEVPGGEARCCYAGPTARALEIQLEDRLFREIWDPRETGTLHVTNLAAWTEPASEALSESEREAVLEALWLLAPHVGGLRTIFTLEAPVMVARRWSRSPTGHFVQVDNRYVDVFELGRTARIPSQQRIEDRVVQVRLGEAKWMHPPDAPMTDADRQRLSKLLESSTEKDFVFTGYSWEFEEE